MRFYSTVNNIELFQSAITPLREKNGLNRSQREGTQTRKNDRTMFRRASHGPTAATSQGSTGDITDRYAAEDIEEQAAQAIPRYPRVASLGAPNEKLIIFRTLMGVGATDELKSLVETDILRRPAPNEGIYARTVRGETINLQRYKVFSLSINVCLGMQIVVAAALTALGAGNGPRALVTAFGAINTVIAGFLTYLKGSGLPQRYKYYSNEWAKVREYIEQRERDFCLEDCTRDVDLEVEIIERMYEDVKSDVEMSGSDSFVSIADQRNRRGVAPGPPIASKPQHNIMPPPPAANNYRRTSRVASPDPPVPRVPMLPKDTREPREYRDSARDYRDYREPEKLKEPKDWREPPQIESGRHEGLPLVLDKEKVVPKS